MHPFQGPCLVDNLIEGRGTGCLGGRGTVWAARVLGHSAVTAGRCFRAVHFIGIDEEVREIFRLTLLKALHQKSVSVYREEF